MTAPFRMNEGGVIDRFHTVTFTVDGRALAGRPGDSLASALLANGVRLMGRSFKYHRPRGVLAAGVEEPNALFGVGDRGRFEPNTRATDVFIYQGLTAISQNRWPSLTFDLGAANQLIARFIPAGFYYKTFFGGPVLWRFYEYFIRRAAGLGKPPRVADLDAFDQRAVFCDVLVVGAGPAGLAAAEAAALAGARVMLVEQDARVGGALWSDPAEIENRPGIDWAESVVARVRDRGGRVLTRATATGFYDHGLVNVIERRAEPGQAPTAGTPAQRLWRVRAKRVVLAQGAIERPVLFSGNDKPGVMLASATRAYVTRYAVIPGRRAVVVGDEDAVRLTAQALSAAGISIAAVLDGREGAQIVAAHGSRRVVGATIIQNGRTSRVACDLIAMAGGRTPVVHLHMQAGGSLEWSASLGAFTPSAARQNQVSVGACAGVLELVRALADGRRAGREASGVSGSDVPIAAATPPSALPVRTAAPAPCRNPKTVFIDFQNDVTVADIDLAWRQGYRSVEHLKRFTTLGMATDQGKTSNLLGLARMAQASGKTAPQVGLTTFRPPYTPVTLGALAGEAVGAHVAPNRRLALKVVHEAKGAVWQPSGYWSRSRAYPGVGETLAAAALREARTVRQTVGLTDVSTLGKFEIVGPDAAAFLEMICANGVAKLAVGRGRYTIMLREDGMIVDDGTVWRLAPERFLLTSSTGGADAMAHRLSYVRRVLAPDLRVMATAVQERWVAIAVAGPRARDVIAQAIGGGDAPSHMSFAQAVVADHAVLVLGASYSGERAFEVYAPSHAAAQVWADLDARVAAAGGGVYGLDAMDMLRIEKGHVVTGAEIDGRTSPYDLGLGKMLRKGGFVGWAALQRPDFQRADRLRLVGLEALDGGVMPEGAMLLPRAGAAPEGHVSSAGRRVLGEGAVGLGLVMAGPDRLGEAMTVSSPTRGLSGRVRLTAPVFYDPHGARYVD